MVETETIEKKQAVDDLDIPVKCADCGHEFDSNPQDWPWESETNEEFQIFRPPFQYPPECPACGSIETDVYMTEVEESRYLAKVAEIASIEEKEKIKAEEEAMKKRKKCCECRRYQLCRDEGMLFDVPCNFHFPIT